MPDESVASVPVSGEDPLLRQLPHRPFAPGARPYLPQCASFLSHLALLPELTLAELAGRLASPALLSRARQPAASRTSLVVNVGTAGSLSSLGKERVGKKELVEAQVVDEVEQPELGEARAQSSFPPAPSARGMR